MKIRFTEYLEFHPRYIWVVFPLKTVQVGTLRQKIRGGKGAWFEVGNSGQCVVWHELSGHRQVSHR